MVSIVVPVYGVEKYIKKCIESILVQDDTDFELILVDDGSKDKSVEIIEETLKDKNINWKLIHKENGGLSSARNAGLKEAKGEYVFFVDSDDAISRDYVSTFKKLTKENDVDFAFCNFEFTKTQDPPIDENNEVELFDKNRLLNVFLRRTINFVVPSMFFKRKFLLDNNLYFRNSIKFSEDQPFIWSVILHSEKSLYSYKKMYGYYVRENSIMTSSSADKILTSYHEYVSFIDELKNEYSNHNDVLDMIIPRWCLGALYTSANISKYQTFKQIYEEMEGKKILKKIKGINDRNTTILAIVAKISPLFMYYSCRSVKL